MHSTIGKEDWEALMEVLQEGIQLLSARQAEPVKLKILEFSSTAAMLGLQDMADCGNRFEGFLLSTVAPDWNEEATATLSFAMGALVEKMQLSSYGPDFSAGLGEVLMYLDFYSAEDPAATDSPVVAKATAPAPVEPSALQSPLEGTASEETSPVSGPETAVDWDSVLEGIFEDVETASEPAPAVESSVPPRVQVSVAGQSAAPGIAAAASPRGAIPIPADAEGFVMDRLEWYREVLREDPQSRLFVVLAEELCDRGLWHEAVALCRQGLVYHPESLRGRVILGRALWETGETGESRRVLMEAHRDIAANAVLYQLLKQVADQDQEALLASDFLQTGRFLEAERLRLAQERPAGAPVERPFQPEPSPLPPILSEVVEAPAKPPEPPETLEPPQALGWLLRLQEVFDHKGVVEPVIDPLFSDDDRATLRALLSASVS